MVRLSVSHLWPLFRCYLHLCLTCMVVICPTHVWSSAETITGSQTVAIRLDNTTLDGVVEVSVHSGVWAYVQPSRRVGSVCCKQLGLGPVSFINSVPAPDGIIYDITCEGTEESLSDCIIHTDRQVYSALRVGCLPASAKELDVILVQRYASLDEGYVFTFVNGAWGPICSPGSQHGLSSVCQTLCKQLNFGGCNEDAQVMDHTIFKYPVLQNVVCPNHASALASCSYQYAEDGCPGEDFLKVSCQNWDTYSETYVYNFSMDFMEYSSVEVPYQTGPAVYDRHRTTLYIIALIAVSFSGMVLYAYRKNRHGTQRIFLDRFPCRNRAVSAPPNGAHHHHHHNQQGAASQAMVMYHPSLNGSLVQYDPPPPIDDSELPTYEEAVALARSEV